MPSNDAKLNEFSYFCCLILNLNIGIDASIQMFVMIM